LHPANESGPLLNALARRPIKREKGERGAERILGERTSHVFGGIDVLTKKHSKMEAFLGGRGYIFKVW
jgi:hypothetical protein